MNRWPVRARIATLAALSSLVLLVSSASAILAAPPAPPRLASLPNASDVAVHPSSSRAQLSASCAIDPTNPNVMLAGALVWDLPVHCQDFLSCSPRVGAYWSLDGGATWVGKDSLGSGALYAPSVAIGHDGSFLIAYEQFFRFGMNNILVQSVVRSQDYGATWSGASISAHFLRDNWMHLATDNSATSPYLGYQYVTWPDGPNNNAPIAFTRSTNDGQSFSEPARICDDADVNGSNTQTGPNGEVYVCWAVYGSTPGDEIAIGFNKSLDGGVTWAGSTRKITNIRGHRNTPLPSAPITHSSFPSMAVDVSGGPYRGNVYIVWTNVGVPGVNTGADTDIWIARSTDGGNTFGSPIRVNNDAGTNSQWLPHVACDPQTGQLAVTFYDRRDDPANAIARAYLATSNDGGVTWDNFPVSDVGFNPAPVPGAPTASMGDRLGLALNGGLPLVVWNDNRTGNQLLYVSPYTRLPAAPANLSCSGGVETATLSWTNPTLNTDGVTPVGDFAGVRVYRDGTLVAELARAATDTGTVDHYEDSPPPGAYYTYQVSAIDSETPANEGPRTSNTEPRFVGPTPAIIVWKAPGVPSSSADSILAALGRLGETAVRVTDLFTFGSDLNVHTMVFACVGVSPNKHVISEVEGTALDDFVQGGGWLYLEGGDCFNLDPVSGGGYDVRPMFGLAAGPNGTQDLFNLAGTNDLAGLAYAYGGPFQDIDDLVPVTSAAVLRNTSTQDVVGVFAPAYAIGRGIGAAFEFGGLRGAPTTPLMSRYLSFFRSPGTPVLAVSADTLRTTLAAADSTAATFAVSNPGAPNAPLEFDVITPANTPWINVAPTHGTVPANASSSVIATLHAGLPGVYTTQLFVTSNDPVRIRDTVTVVLTVLGSKPTFVPSSLTIDVSTGGTVVDSSLTLSNAAGGDLYYSLAMIGLNGSTTEGFGDSTITATALSGWIGNIFSVETGVPITGIQQLLDAPASTLLEFFVFEQQPGASMWRKVFSKQVPSGVGRAWRSSGSILVLLQPSRRYFIGCSHSGVATAFRDDGAGVPYGASFGTLEESSEGSGFLAPDSGLFATSSTAWAQAIQFGIPVRVTIAPLMGTLSGGASQKIRLTAKNATVPGVYTALLNAFHDAPLQPTLAVPITIRVGQSPAGAPPPNPTLPDRLALRPGIPNPFRDRTEFRLELPEAMGVRLEIFDPTGRRVRLLLDEPRPAGRHSVHWDGQDGEGHRLAPGVYLVSLRVGGERQTKRVVVLAP